MTDQPFKDRINDRRVVTLLLLGLVVLFGGLYVAAYAVTSDRVPRNATVGGVEIGGLHPTAATAKLRDELGPAENAPIVVAADGRRAKVTPRQAGLSIDYDASVDQAGGGRSWSPGRMWDYATGGDDFEPVVDVDRARLDESVDGLAKKIDKPAVDGGVTFRKGTAKPHLPKAGRQLDRDKAAAAITGAFPAVDADEPVELDLTEVTPEVTEEEVRSAVKDFADPAMSAPVILVLDNHDVVVRPTAYSQALSMKAEDGELVPHVNKKKLMAAVRPAMKGLSLRPQPATVKLVDGRPKVVPGKNGVTFDPDEVADEFLSLVVKDDKKRTYEVNAVVDKPDFTTKDARKLGVKEVVSSFTTYFPYAEYRNVNLGRAADIVNGTLLKPGETFSLNGTVGERTAENGFTKGYIISDGVYKEDYGGGVSQVATTLFNAAFFAGLEDIEHKPHSFYIDRYPIGREATVVWGALDLKFRNDTPHGVLIQSWVKPSTSSSTGEMHVQIWSTKYWDITAGVSDRYNKTEEETRYLQGKNCVEHEGYGGFDIDVFRYFRRHGSDGLERKETMHTTYTPSDTVVCGKDPNA